MGEGWLVAVGAGDRGEVTSTDTIKIRTLHKKREGCGTRKTHVKTAPAVLLRKYLKAIDDKDPVRSCSADVHDPL